MNYRYIHTSLTRISDLEQGNYEIKRLPRPQWESGDYVAAEITSVGSDAKIELTNGRMMDPLKGEKVIGAFGVRHATLEATGSWKNIPPSGEMHMLTGAGLFGLMTSYSVFSPYPIGLKYLGHVKVRQHKVNMRQMIPKTNARPLNIPVILMVGTSMSAGKTTTARIITRQLKLMGKKVVAAKLTGAGRYRDILAVFDAGADYIFDFVDAGLPSTVCAREKYVDAYHHMMSLMAGTDADVAVVEIGASPLEPYNGDVAIHLLQHKLRSVILCASDPYAVYGVMKSFDITPDLVSGPATNTIAGVELVEKLCRVKAANLLDPGNLALLREVLMEGLGFKLEKAKEVNI